MLQNTSEKHLFEGYFLINGELSESFSKMTVDWAYSFYIVMLILFRADCND